MTPTMRLPIPTLAQPVRLVTRHGLSAALVLAAALCTATPALAAEPGPQVAPVTAPAQGAPPVKAGSQTFNTVITKLKAGKQIFSNTIIGPDLDAARKACEGVDFIWIEMQHS